MLDFSFSEDQELFRTNLREFCQSKVAPSLKEMEQKKEIPRQLLRDMADIGLLAMSVSPEYGGGGLDAVMAGIAAEELARADVSGAIPAFFLIHNSWSYLVDKYGTKKLKDELLPRIRKGEIFLGIASTESDMGSDLAAMKTRLTRDGDGYLLNGEKCYISGVREAGVWGGGFVTLAKTTPELGTRGMTLFYLPLKGVKGITTTFLEEMGRDGISWGNMHIDNVRIPRHYVIGQENKGFYIVHEGYEFARCLVALVCVGAASKSLENAMTYMKSRKTFGSPIASHEGLQFPLAEDYIKIEAARLLAYKALWMYQGEQKAGRFQRFEVTKAIAMAKAVAPTWAFQAINDAMQWQGAFGYSKECPEQKALRGVRSFSFAEGTVEIMKLIVARELLGREYISPSKKSD